MLKKARIVYFCPPILLMVFIFILSSIPGEIEYTGMNFIMSIDPALQNLLHIPLYGLLSYLWFRALKMIGLSILFLIIVGILLTAFYGVLDEIHQTFVIGRYGSFSDLVLDFVGAVCGAFIYCFKSGDKVRNFFKN